MNIGILFAYKLVVTFNGFVYIEFEQTHDIFNEKKSLFFFKLFPTLLRVDLRAVYTADAGDEAIMMTGRQKETKIFQNHQIYVKRINFSFLVSH